MNISKVTLLSVGALFLIIMAIFMIGRHKIKSHEQVYMEGHSMSDLAFSFSPDTGVAQEVLERNQKVLEPILFQMLQERDDFCETLYLEIMKFLEFGKSRTLLDYRGAYSDHVSAVSILMYFDCNKDTPIYSNRLIKELRLLREYYKGSDYAICNDFDYVILNFGAAK